MERKKAGEKERDVEFMSQSSLAHRQDASTNATPYKENSCAHPTHMKKKAPALKDCSDMGSWKRSLGIETMWCAVPQMSPAPRHGGEAKYRTV